jgi:hypothetical protein
MVHQRVFSNFIEEHLTLMIILRTVDLVHLLKNVVLRVLLCVILLKPYKSAGNCGSLAVCIKSNHKQLLCIKKAPLFFLTIQWFSYSFAMPHYACHLMSKYHQFATLELAARQCAKIGENLAELNEMLQQEEKRLYTWKKEWKPHSRRSAVIFKSGNLFFSPFRCRVVTLSSPALKTRQMSSCLLKPNHIPGREALIFFASCTEETMN